MPKPRSARPHDRAVINDAMRRDIAEQLLLGTPAPRIVERLASRGIAGGIAATEVDRAARSPYLLGAERLQARLRKREWLIANRARLDVLRTADPVVPRRDRLAADSFFEDYYCANRPVLVTGLVDHWPARHWQFEQLAGVLGATDIDVQWQRDRNPGYEREAHRHVARQPFAAIVRRILDGGTSNDFYVTAFNNAHNRIALAPLWGDVGDIPGWLAPQQGADGFFWMGPQGTITPWHHDLTNNLLVQIVGRKRVRLVSPAETPRMRNNRHCFSDWSGDDLPAGSGDAERPPVLAIDIEPGDALFLPIGWWHHVEALTPTIGLSFINFARGNDFYSHYSSYDAV